MHRTFALGWFEHNGERYWTMKQVPPSPFFSSHTPHTQRERLSLIPVPCNTCLTLAHLPFQQRVDLSLVPSWGQSSTEPPSSPAPSLQGWLLRSPLATLMMPVFPCTPVTVSSQQKCICLFKDVSWTMLQSLWGWSNMQLVAGPLGHAWEDWWHARGPPECHGVWGKWKMLGREPWESNRAATVGSEWYGHCFSLCLT